ncbi:MULTISPECIES: response regulator transcription factor [Bacillaceae]|uniref:Two-component system response regulator n=1 Tax=Domibacillus aminovorans TaxID=29332 RepID=A0A177KIG1_9BACI|nr:MULTISPECIES: response regulator transcription factor [Bacillaceae]OAH52904.1 two-component system response regulator [Domibacillus aminovorans]
MRKSILIVDDEWNMRNLLKIHLMSDYDLAECSNGQDAIALVQKHLFDLILLDVMMPEMDGWEVCKAIRTMNTTPILMLTARNELKDKVHGLEIGADDYLIKPFELEELLARVKALLRRSDHHAPMVDDSSIVFGNGYFKVDRDGYQVFLDNEKLDLTPKEYEFIETIALSPKRVFTREVLLDLLWGFNDSRDMRTVDSHVKNIRIKIRETGSNYNPVQTVWGVGYKFQEPDQTI